MTDSPSRPVAFIDASVIVALVDARDRSHALAVAAYRDLLAAGYRFFTTDFVIAEAFDLVGTEQAYNDVLFMNEGGRVLSVEEIS